MSTLLPSVLALVSFAPLPEAKVPEPKVTDRSRTVSVALEGALKKSAGDITTADLLAAVLAALSRLDRLTVEGTGAGRGGAAGLDADCGTQGVADLLPGAVPAPPLEVVVDRLPGGEVVRQSPPGTDLAGVLEQSVDDLPPAGLAGLAASAGTRQQRLEQVPLLVPQVAQRGVAFHTSFYADPV